jgi:hypothetical protein
MTTDLAALRVETRVLVAFGVERYEDAVVYDAARRYLIDVGAVPASAWGTLPVVSERLRRGWETALGSRVEESRIARDESDRMADGLLQAATEYEGADLVAAVDFEQVNADVRPYLPLVDGYADAVRTRVGGDGVLALPSHRRLPDDRPTVAFPPDNERLQALRREVLPATRVVEEPLVLSSDGEGLGISGGRTTHYENGGGDLLDQFVQEYRDVLLQLEALMTELGTGHRLPLSDLIVHAWRSSPRVIENRADLIHSIAQSYRARSDELELDLEQVRLYWEGRGVVAFTQYAGSVSRYVDALAEQARWLADEGKKAASQLEGLRNAYAETGVSRIGSLIQALDEYRASVTGMFSACTNPEQAFITAVGDFVGFLLASESRYAAGLADLVGIAEQERGERPDLGTRAHAAVPLPRSQIEPDAWTRRDGDWWRPVGDGG